MLAGLAVGLSLLTPALIAAQELDDGDTPLGDVARNLRKQSPPSQQEIIDNDNLSKVMDDVDSHRATRNSLMYSIDGAGKAFQVSAPDVTCSLSFSTSVKSLLASSYVQMELPADQLLKLSGPAAIRGDSLEVSVFNGTQWHVSEVAVALTVVRRTDFPEASLRDQPGRDQLGRDRSGKDGLAKVIPAAAVEPSPERPSQRRSLREASRHRCSVPHEGCCGTVWSDCIRRATERGAWARPGMALGYRAGEGLSSAAEYSRTGGGQSRDDFGDTTGGAGDGSGSG